MASIEHRERGNLERWRVVWRQGGVKQQRTFRTAAAADRFRKRVEGYGNQWPPGEDPREQAPAGGLSFGDWARRAVAMRTGANERTRADYLRDLERHLGILEAIPVADVDVAAVTAWIGHLRRVDDHGARVLSDKTVRNLHGLVSSVMADALAQHPPLATHNPFARRLGDAGAGVHTEEMTFLTPAEFATLAVHVPDYYSPLIRFLVGTGLRFGEATALTRDDVNVFGPRRTVTVTKAWKRVGTSDWQLGEPKTRRSRRTLSLSDELVDLLIPLLTAPRYSTTDGRLLFVAAADPGAGRRLSHGEVYKRAWLPAVARANVCDAHYWTQRDGRGNPPRIPAPCDCLGVLGKRPRIHDLRHSHISWLIADGHDLTTISRRAGHSSITITIDRYGHLDPTLDDKINRSVDRALTIR